MDTIETILLSAKFVRDHPEISAKIIMLPFSCFHSKFRMFLLYFPLSQGKQKAMRKAKPKEILGIFADHVARTAKRAGIPNTYIKDFTDSRYLTRMIKNVSENRLDELNCKLFNLIDAILEKREQFKPGLFDFALREHNEIRREINESIEKAQ